MRCWINALPSSSPLVQRPHAIEALLHWEAPILYTWRFSVAFSRMA